MIQKLISYNHGNFTPNKGLHQRDPLLPFLFLLCAEGLHSLIQQAENSSSIKGVSLCSASPKVSHLFFANDGLLFCWENTQQCATILDVLQKYEEASSQQINQDKTQLFFSPNTDPYMQKTSKISQWLQTPLIMTNILVFHHLLVVQKSNVSVTFENGSSIKCKVGKKDYCHKVVEKC